PEENPQHKSITELEYREAIQTGKACLIFLLAEDAPWSRTMMDVVTGEGNCGECINALRRELAQKKVVKFFTTPEHLASLVAPSVHLWESSRNTSDSSASSTQTSVKHAQEAERIARLEAMFADHSGFIRDRLSSFVGRVKELVDIRQRITSLQSSGGYITITGQAGQGKSSIIAKLVEEYGPDKTAHHFIPFNPGPDHQVGLLRNVMARLIMKYDLPDFYVVSESRAGLRDYLPKVLAEISSRGGQEVIFIDGLDQLTEDQNGERDLSFLPTNPPEGVVFVLGTRPNDTLRPLELLKSHHTYQLPNLNRYDFDLILAHRNVELEKSLADQFYDTMQKNALYLDLVAKELAQEESGKPEEVIKHVANNPENIFSLSIMRLKRHTMEWREVLRPILGVLLVAREPLTTRHMRHILAIEDDERLREGLARLGGLIADDGRQRYSLFHLKLYDYLRQDERNPNKEYVFATDEEENWHRNLADWCGQGKLSVIWEDVKRNPVEQRRREYARQHYITHLYYARDWSTLFAALDEGSYGQAKVRYDPSTRLYAQDLDLGRQAAAWNVWDLDEGLEHLPNLWRYTLLRCSLASRVDKYPLAAFRLLVALERAQEAVSLAELLTDQQRKARTLLEIATQMRKKPNVEQESIQLLLRGCEVALTISEPHQRASLLSKLGVMLAQARQWERAEEVIRIIEQSDQRMKAEYGLMGALVQAQEWKRAAVFIRTM
ncbi:MAG: hypothetical protein JO123_01395, partial [Ktedonobacteraceae bacterium]|nr:hypothetical protein [Ktedonobacteraceae bacterium]